MAIKVGGTTVVDDSRNLTNIASVDATTVAALSAAGVGDITSVTAGSGLTGGGTSGAVTINHQDTSSQGSVNNSGNTVIQDITLDTYGHITSINSTTISASPSTSTGATGTYAFLANYHNGSTKNPGNTVAGSVMDYAGCATNGVQRTTTSPGGSWRCMGYATYTSATVWVRYA